MRAHIFSPKGADCEDQHVPLSLALPTARALHISHTNEAAPLSRSGSWVLLDLLTIRLVLTVFRFDETRGSPLLVEDFRPAKEVDADLVLALEELHEFLDRGPKIKTPNGERIGRGFLESTGYADNQIQLLRLSGLPETEEMLQLMPPADVSPELRAQSEEFLLEPENAVRLSEILAACRGL